MSKEPTQKNTLPPPLRPLAARDVAILTRLPLRLIEGCIAGKFKPNESDRKKMTSAGMAFQAFNAFERTEFVMRRKYRIVRHFLTQKEKDGFYYTDEDYAKKINEYVLKYWPRIERAIAAGG